MFTKNQCCALFTLTMIRGLLSIAAIAFFVVLQARLAAREIAPQPQQPSNPLLEQPYTPKEI